jgi:hypothetical protein
MALIKSLPHRLKKLFLEGFSVMDIAEPLPSFDQDRPAGDVRTILEQQHGQVAGLRRNGHVQGYVLRKELSSGSCGEAKRRFHADEIVEDSASLFDTIRTMKKHGWCFVSYLGEVSAVVLPADLEKPPVRMWLFGMITIVEVKLAEEIRRRFPDDSWQQHLSAGRLAKTQELMLERQRRKLPADAVECLQLTDKAAILMQDENARQEMDFVSMRAGKQLIKALGSLRNHLAHTQQFIATDWEAVVLLALRMENILAASGNVGGEDSQEEDE